MESKEERRERWRLLIEAYQRGKRTQRAFCQDHGVALWVFRYWLRKQQAEKLSKTDNPQRLLPVQVTQVTPVSTGNLLLAFPNGLELKFAYSTLAEDLAGLVAVLRRVTLC